MKDTFPIPYDVLLSCSSFVIRKSRRSGIQLDLLFKEEMTSQTDLNQVVAGELWVFLQEKAGQMATIAQEKLTQGDLSGFITFLSDSFLAHCLDGRRTISVNTSYAYYRHVRSVLSKAEEVRYEATRRGSFYAYSFSPDLAILPQEHWSASYQDWPAPETPCSVIHQAQGILGVSRFFWDRSCDRFLSDHLLPIKELTRFVETKYAITVCIANESDLVQRDGEGNLSPLALDEISLQGAQQDTLGCERRQNPRLDLDVIETELEILARDCWDELSERQRTILAGVDAGQSLEELARRLDMKGAPNAHYHLKRGYEIVRRKWSLWGPPSLAGFSEVEEEEFFIFYDKVVGLCKTGGECRNG